MEHSSERPADEKMEQIVTEYGTPLLRLCLMMLGRNMDAEDAVSETFFRYFQKAPSFQDASHEKAWLYTVAANICRDMLRKRKRLLSLEDSTLSSFAQAPEDRSVLEALEALPEKYRTVIYLHYIEGYKTGEIAALLDIRPGTVRKRLQYGREQLKLEYEQE